jgi:hypothetical protein
MATEHAATHIAIYAPVGIPELLHAEDYARALAADSGNVPAAVQARAVAATLARQRAILIARPTEVTVILAAAALRQKVGETAVTRDQLHYLAELAAAHPRVTIQLLPLTASLHAAGGSGTFPSCASATTRPRCWCWPTPPAAAPCWTTRTPSPPMIWHSPSYAPWRSRRRSPPAGSGAWPEPREVTFPAASPDARCRAGVRATSAAG